jgi:hypothetical protein
MVVVLEVEELSFDLFVVESDVVLVLLHLSVDGPVEDRFVQTLLLQAEGEGLLVGRLSRRLLWGLLWVGHGEVHFYAEVVQVGDLAQKHIFVLRNVRNVLEIVVFDVFREFSNLFVFFAATWNYGWWFFWRFSIFLFRELFGDFGQENVRNDVWKWLFKLLLESGAIDAG